LIASRRGVRGVSLYRLAKNERANIDDGEPDERRHIGQLYLALDEPTIAAA
jgi:hypothetical protein